MKKFALLLAMAIAALSLSAATTPMVINIKPSKSDATAALQKAIDRAAAQKGRPVEIRLAPGEYHISRAKSTPRVRFISNTTTPQENPDPTKHIGLFIHGIKNLTIDGCGARFITHGEMTPWAIDSCENVTLKNFSIDAADPSVPEMTVTESADDHITARVHPRSRYEIRSGKLYWIGEGWEFTDGIAQIYSPTDSTTLRTESPVAAASSVTELEPGLLRFNYSGRRPAPSPVGSTYQMRHSFRNEVAGLINFSSRVTLSDLNLHFMGNFGIVAQMSTDLTYTRIRCAVDPLSGRTCAGFADFMQVSGCRGQVDITDCYFAGAHDDPINVHGTHLRIIDAPAPDRLHLRYMHAQTRGFLSFTPGDTVAVVDSRSLQRVAMAVVTSAALNGEFDMDVTLDRPLPDSVTSLKNAVLENVTYSPAVRIQRCHFTLTPTRGILITTWRPVLISSCTFFRCPMSAVLIADDARSWYESGPVKDVTIRDNVFIDCVSPVIWIAPEASVNAGPVHENITIQNNLFHITGRFKAAGTSPEIRARLVEGLDIEDNTVISPNPASTLRINTESCTPVLIL
ncbi:MAG: right-handed parallel beta-helix repeat-containing protein [Muribaculaceae bacterium]|nr:right-handed parallel beta-helix repeat-containing protein [Muribaculaceae bacterium]